MNAWIRRPLSAAALAIACLLSGSAFADGLIHDLPEDGSWVRFDVVQEYFDLKTGMVNRTLRGTQTVSSVGKAIVDGQPYRYVELKQEWRQPDDKTVGDVCKLLVPEALIAHGENPLDDCIGVWIRRLGERGATNPPFEVNLSRLGRLPKDRYIMQYSAALRDRFYKSLQEMRSMGDRPLVGKAGRFECTGTNGFTFTPFDSAKGVADEKGPNGGERKVYEAWQSKAIPFGVMRFRCENERRDPNGQLMFHWVVTYDLVAIGKEAKSEIPEDLNPAMGQAAYQAAQESAEKQDFNQAIIQYTQAISFFRSYAPSYDGRGEAYAKKQDYEKAVADFRESIRRDPKRPEGYDRLAWLLATSPEEKHRDGKAAVEAATKACELAEWKSERFLGTLAAAHAEAGQFEQAVKHQVMAIDLADEQDKPLLRQRLLENYKVEKPLRDAPPR